MVGYHYYPVESQYVYYKIIVGAEVVYQCILNPKLLFSHKK